ncbi:MAG: hypothetical protein ACKVPJ_02785 [Chitinophagales bacterium]
MLKDWFTPHNFESMQTLRSFRKLLLAAGFLAIIGASLSSCHREGCPNKITNTTSKSVDNIS